MIKTFLASAVLLAAASAYLGGVSPQGLFEGQLEVVHFKAPEFPQAVQISGSAPSAPFSPSASGPAGAAPGANGPVPPSTEGQVVPSLQFNATGIAWINSPPLAMAKLRGKVVMIDFWEYTCINCIRTFPENKKWWRRYHRYGFEIIGVHDPEFNVAYSVKNVRAAVKRFQLPYPVVVDDQFRIWNAYHSQFWPNRFLIDAKGYVRYHRAGEGGDSAFELAIQQLLKEAHPGLKFPASYTIAPAKDAFSPACGVPTAEMYVGDWEGRGILESPQGYHDGRTLNYTLPATVNDGRVGLSGRWRSGKNGMTYHGGSRKKKGMPGELVMRYHARQLYSVINVAHDRPERLYITQDGKDLTSTNNGADVKLDTQGHSYIEVRKPRMYYLVQNPSFGSHVVTLRPAASGITINSFTFGNNCQTHFAHL